MVPTEKRVNQNQKNILFSKCISQLFPYFLNSQMYKIGNSKEYKIKAVFRIILILIIEIIIILY